MELAAVEFGLKYGMDLYHNLTGAVRPINVVNINVFTDSMITLSWIKSKAIEFGKVDKKLVFINNKLSSIMELCTSHAVTFDHVDGVHNPADMVTRAVSHSVLSNTCYVSGPNFCGIISGNLFSVPLKNSKVCRVITKGYYS